MRFIIKVILISISFVPLYVNSSITEAIEEEIPYSIEMLPWEIVNEILPNKSIFTVMDVETGQKFNVQRRAGNRHADVQPLTREDTKVMKEIYDGKWDWKRRAIIVISDNNWIAASMHGMPHGVGALKNNFPGHFCIHFYGSKTHLSNNMDISHKLMIYKAAGKLDEYISSIAPAELVKSFIAGIKQQDHKILSSTSHQDIEWKQFINQIENIQLTDLNIITDSKPEDDLNLEIDVKIDWIMKKNIKRTYEGKMSLIRLSPIEPWKIDTIRFLKDSDIYE